MNRHIPVFPVTHCPKTVKWVSSVEFVGEVVYRKDEKGSLLSAKVILRVGEMNE